MCSDTNFLQLLLIEAFHDMHPLKNLYADPSRALLSVTMVTELKLQKHLCNLHKAVNLLCIHDYVPDDVHAQEL